MTYLAILALVVVAALLYQARGVIGVILCDAPMRVGDFEGALRRLRCTSLGIPNAVTLHKEGLILSLAGRAAEAELCYRKALGLVQGGFQHAIEAGDRTGNSEDGLAELRLVRGVEIDQALAFTCQAIEHAKRRADGRVPGACYALQAWALALLGRADEAREALAHALRVPEPNPRTSASLHWRAGMALLALRQTEEGRQHFQTAYDLDPRGKYGARCRQYLA